VLESGQCYFFGFYAAANLRSILEHHHSVASFCKICCRHQAVVSRARDDNIEFVGRSGLRRQAKWRERKWRECRRSFGEFPPRHFAHVILPICQRAMRRFV
jgi:hypothetical protein